MGAYLGVRRAGVFRRRAQDASALHIELLRVVGAHIRHLQREGGQGKMDRDAVHMTCMQRQMRVYNNGHPVTPN